MSTRMVLGLDLAKVTMPEAITAMVYAWLDAQDVDSKSGEMQASDSLHVPMIDIPGTSFSDWLKTAPVAKTKARKLVSQLGIEMRKVRCYGISALVAWLSPEQIELLNASISKANANPPPVEHPCNPPAGESKGVRLKDCCEMWGISINAVKQRARYLGVDLIYLRSNWAVWPLDKVGLGDRLNEFLQQRGNRMADFPVPADHSQP